MFTIYLITCQTNGKVYVGQTRKTITQRFSSHKSKARICSDNSYKLNRAIRKYGEDNFVITKITEAETQEQANDLESFYIKTYDSVNTGYNVCPYGSAHPQTEETKRKISEIKTGVPLSEQHKLNISKNHSRHFLGKKHTEQTKKLISDKNSGNTNWLGKHHTNETKIKISQSKIGLYNGKNNPFYGKTHTEEVKKIIAISNRNRSKLTQIQVDDIRGLLNDPNFNIKQIAEKFGVSPAIIRNIKSGKTWKN